MGINLTNFLTSKSKNTRMMDFQDLDHIDGLSISALSADLYKTKRDDLVMFYFREGANFASVYTQSKILSENIKWNLNQKTKKIYGTDFPVITINDIVNAQVNLLDHFGIKKLFSVVGGSMGVCKFYNLSVISLKKQKQ